MDYSIKEMCIALNLNRSSYYKWKKRNPSKSELLNKQITEYVKDFYEESNGVLGYRQMCININREKTNELPHNVNVKRIRRIMRILGLKSVIRKKRPDYVKSTPEITAENVLKRDFKATVPFEKWLTDVTEFKYYVGSEVKKLYLSSRILYEIVAPFPVYSLLGKNSCVLEACRAYYEFQSEILILYLPPFRHL